MIEYFTQEQARACAAKLQEQYPSFRFSASDRGFDEETGQWIVSVWDGNRCIRVLQVEQQWQDFMDICHIVVRECSRPLA